VREADIVIFSSAIKPGNVAYDEAHRLGKMMVRRADRWRLVMHRKRGIAVAGMHGKTTTSSMAAHVCAWEGAAFPLRGREIPILGTNAHWDPEGEYFVAEGDESTAPSRLYHPEHSILLNIERRPGFLREP